MEFYTSVADNYAPFYSLPIECTDRDAAFVLDGLLYNESELEIEEHYTYTHGYTEINFAAFAMLGRVAHSGSGTRMSRDANGSNVLVLALFADDHPCPLAKFQGIGAVYDLRRPAKTWGSRGDIGRY